LQLGYHTIPNRGDQVEQLRIGVRRLGVVWYADQLQVLVKWQDGRSSSLRLGRDQFSIRTPAEEDARSLNGKAAEENHAHSLAARVAAS
jgi:hypothetical protein